VVHDYTQGATLFGTGGATSTGGYASVVRVDSVSWARTGALAFNGAGGLPLLSAFPVSFADVARDYAYFVTPDAALATLVRVRLSTFTFNLSYAIPPASITSVTAGAIKVGYGVNLAFLASGESPARVAVVNLSLSLDGGAVAPSTTTLGPGENAVTSMVLDVNSPAYTFVHVACGTSPGRIVSLRAERADSSSLAQRLGALVFDAGEDMPRGGYFFRGRNASYWVVAAGGSASSIPSLVRVNHWTFTRLPTVPLSRAGFSLPAGGVSETVEQNFYWVSTAAVTPVLLRVQPGSSLPVADANYTDLAVEAGQGPAGCMMMDLGGGGSATLYIGYAAAVDSGVQGVAVQLRVGVPSATPAATPTSTRTPLPSQLPGSYVFAPAWMSYLRGADFYLTATYAWASRCGTARFRIRTRLAAT
jgi:hypothetical protein